MATMISPAKDSIDKDTTYVLLRQLVEVEGVVAVLLLLLLLLCSCYYYRYHRQQQQLLNQLLKLEKIAESLRTGGTTIEEESVSSSNEDIVTDMHSFQNPPMLLSTNTNDYVKNYTDYVNNLYGSTVSSSSPSNQTDQRVIGGGNKEFAEKSNVRPHYRAESTETHSFKDRVKNSLTGYSWVLFENNSSVRVKFVIEEEELTEKRKSVLNGSGKLKVVELKKEETLTVERGVQKPREIEVSPGESSKEGMQTKYIVHVSVHSFEDGKWLGPHFRRELNPNEMSRITFMKKHRDATTTESSKLLDEEHTSEFELEIETRLKKLNDSLKKEEEKIADYLGRKKA